jgi:hypothetical protein
MNAAPSLAPTDIRACAIGQAPRETTATPARARQHGMPALRCFNEVGMARRGFKTTAPEAGPKHQRPQRDCGSIDGTEVTERTRV